MKTESEVVQIVELVVLDGKNTYRYVDPYQYTHHL